MTNMHLTRSAFYILFLLLGLSAAATPKGHLQPLGSHRDPHRDVATVDAETFNNMNPAEFFKKYIDQSVPLLIKGGAKHQPAFSLWSNEYLTEKYGNELIEVEEGKKENRDLGLWSWKMEKFLKHYEKDMYSVSAVPLSMRHEYMLPNPLNCPAYTQHMRQLNHWFSSGGTVSVLHKDQFENVNCLLDGQKELLFFDKELSEDDLHWDSRQNHGHSKVDADRVDMLKYPGFVDLDYMRVHLNKGDCIYIPSGWYHQVRSGDPSVIARNYGINIWFFVDHNEAPKCMAPSEPLRMSEVKFDAEEFPEGEDDDDEKSSNIRHDEH